MYKHVGRYIPTYYEVGAWFPALIIDLEYEEFFFADDQATSLTKVHILALLFSLKIHA